MKRLMVAVAAFAAVAAALLAATAGAGSPAPPITSQPFVYLSIDDQSVTEGDSATMTIRAWPMALAPIYVSWGTTEHTASAGLDYPVQAGGAVIPFGRQSTTITLLTTEDAIHEQLEHFHVYISSSQPFVKLAKPQADLTIIDDDEVSTCTAGSENFSSYSPGDEPTTFGGAAGGTIDTAYTGGVLLPIAGFPGNVLFSGHELNSFHLTFNNPVGSVQLKAESNYYGAPTNLTLTAYKTSGSVDTDTATQVGQMYRTLSVTSTSDDIESFTIATDDTYWGIFISDIVWACN